MTFDIGIGRRSHDLVFDERQGAADILMIDGPERVAQDLKIALLTFAGDYFLDANEGIDYFNQVLVKNPDKILLESIFRACASRVRDVSQVLELHLLIDHANRKLGIALSVATPWGPIELEVFLNG